MKKIRGFTLIELVVVIAIIGLLAGIVITSLGNARTGSKDTRIKSEMTSMRIAAEAISATTGTYDTVCDTTSESGRIFADAFSLGPKTDNFTICLDSDTTGKRASSGALVDQVKAASPGQWAATAQLNESGKWFCIDSTGFSGEVSTRVLDWSPLTIVCPTS